MSKKLAETTVNTSQTASDAFELIELATVDIETIAKAFDIITEAAETPISTFRMGFATEEKVVLN